MLTPVRLLLVLALALAAGLASLWVDQQGHWRNIVWAAPAAKLPDVKPLVDVVPAAAGALTVSYASIQERPLFAPDRRPPPPPAPPPPPDPFATIQMYGIFSGTNAGILARVDGKVRRVKVGESIGSWTLKSIDGRKISFVQGDQTRDLSLAYAKLNTVAPVPVLAPPRPGALPAAGTVPVADPTSAYREELRKRNELRASRGLPLLPN